MFSYVVCYLFCYLLLRKFGCNKTNFRRNLVIRRQAQLDGELTNCNALVTLGIFVSLNCVTLIPESPSVARFGNTVNSIRYDFMKNSMLFPMVYVI